jgi:hypothetical protein
LQILIKVKPIGAYSLIVSFKSSAVELLVGCIHQYNSLSLFLIKAY